MKTKKIILSVLLVLLLAVILIAVNVSRTASDIPTNAVSVISHGTETILELDEQQLEDINGDLVNGKGETIRYEGKGLCLSKLSDETVDKVTVTSVDNYSAELEGNELENAYLAIEDGSVRLVVFGDANMKRNVRNVVSVKLEIVP